MCFVWLKGAPGLRPGRTRIPGLFNFRRVMNCASRLLLYLAF